MPTTDMLFFHLFVTNCTTSRYNLLFYIIKPQIKAKKFLFFKIKANLTNSSLLNGVQMIHHIVYMARIKFPHIFLPLIPGELNFYYFTC